MTTSSTTNSPSSSQVARLSQANDGVSLSLNTSPHQGLSRIPDRVLGISFSFLSIDALFTLQQVDKQANRVAKRALELFANPMDLESSTCARLLTSVYHMQLARVQNPREALKDVSTVAIRQGVLFLNPRAQNEETLGLRHISEEDLETLKKTLSSQNPIPEKQRVAKSLIDKALAFPPHRSVRISLTTDLTHGADLHAGLVFRRLNANGSLLEIIRVITLNEPKATRFHIQAIDVTSVDETAKPRSYEEYQEMQLASERRKEDTYTLASLNEAIGSAFKTAKPKVPAMLAFHLYTKDGQAIAQNESAPDLEYLMKEAMAVNICAKSGVKLLYVTRPWSLGGKVRTFS